MQNFSAMYLLNLAVKRIWALVLTAVVFAATTFAYCSLIVVPQYSATSTVLITNGRVSASYNQGDYYNYKGESGDGFVSGTDISSSITLTYTVLELLKSPDVFIKLADKLDGKYTYEFLMGRTTVENRGERTLLLDVKFRSSDGEEAMHISNAFSELICEYVPECITYSTAKVVTTALKFHKVSPATLTNTATAAFIGAVVAFIIVFIIDFSDQSVRGEEELIEKYDIAFLGSIPDFDSVTSAGSATYGYNAKGGYYGDK